MPKWMTGSPGSRQGIPDRRRRHRRAVPQNIIVGVAAAVAIASASLSAGQEAWAIAVYVLVAGSAWRFRSWSCSRWARSSDDPGQLEAWLGQNNAVVMSVLSLILPWC